MMAQMALAVPGAPEDEDLITAAAGGDRAAFGELYVRHSRMVHAILLARVPPGDAEDLMQDVFVAALDRLRGLRTAAAFRAWLAAIARNRALDYLRGSRRGEPLDEVNARAGALPPAAEARQALEVIQGLPEAYRETLVMRLVEGMTGPEIAEQTGLKPESVRVNLCRGMKLLRERLGEGGTR